MSKGENLALALDVIESAQNSRIPARVWDDVREAVLRHLDAVLHYTESVSEQLYEENDIP